MWYFFEKYCGQPVIMNHNYLFFPVESGEFTTRSCAYTTILKSQIECQFFQTPHSLLLPQPEVPRRTRLYITVYCIVPFPNINDRLSMKYWSSFTAARSPLTNTCHSAWALPRSTIRTAAKKKKTKNPYICLFISYTLRAPNNNIKNIKQYNLSQLNKIR